MSLTRKNALLTLFWSGIGTVQYFLKSIFMVTFFLKYREQQEYGFWIILISFSGMAIYVCDGYVRYCLNEYNLAYHSDKEKAKRFFSDGLAFLLAACFVIFSGFLLAVHYLPLSAEIFNTSVSVVSDKYLHYCLFIVLLLGLSHCVIKYISGALEPAGNVHITNRYISIYSVCETAVLFLCIFLSASLFKMFFAAFVVLFLVNSIYLISIFRKYALYKSFKRGVLKNGVVLFVRSLIFLVNNFLERLTIDGINFMVTLLYPAGLLLPAYASTRTMANVMVSTGNTFIGVFSIEYQRLTVQRDGERLMKIFHGIWLLLGLVVNFGLVCCYPLLTRIYAIWTSNKLPVNDLFFYLIFSMVVLNVYGAVVIAFAKSLNAVKRLMLISLCRALVIFLLIIVLPRTSYYLALSLLIGEFIVNVILLNVLFYKEMTGIGTQNVAPKLFWNVLPFVLTAIFLIVISTTHVGYMPAAITMLATLLVVYFIQFRVMKNDLLLSNLRYIRSGLLLFRKDGK